MGDGELERSSVVANRASGRISAVAAERPLLDTAGQLDTVITRIDLVDSFAGPFRPLWN
jgi:hypothetical protein